MKPICVTAQSLLGDRPKSQIDRYTVSETGCWVWGGALDRYGYGTVSMKIGGRRRLIGAHRVSWWAHRGPIQGGLQLDHLCRNRACINPWHLEPVTSAENTRRGMLHSAEHPKTTGRPRVPLDQRKCCRRHGQSDGKWTTRKDGYTVWACRLCNRERLARWKAAHSVRI